MNIKSMAVLCILFLVSFTASSCGSGAPNILGPTPTPTLTPTSTPTPTPAVPGVTTPIIINEISMVFYEAETMGTSGFDPYIIRPEAPFDMLISIKALGSNIDQSLWFDLQVQLEYSKDGERHSVECIEYFLSMNLANARFLFPTYKEGVTDYELVFSGGQRIPLNGLIDITTGTNL